MKKLLDIFFSHYIKNLQKKAFNFDALDWPDGEDNMGGFTTQAFVCPISQIASFPALVDDPETAADKITLQGDFVCNDGASFKEVYITPETGKYDFANQGEIDGQSFHITGDFLHPGSKDENLAFARDVNNSGAVMIMIENNGKRVVIGTPNLPCRFKPKGSLGTAPKDRKGINYEFAADSFVPLYRYLGVIPLEDSVLPGISS